MLINRACRAQRLQLPQVKQEGIVMSLYQRSLQESDWDALATLARWPPALFHPVVLPVSRIARMWSPSVVSASYAFFLSTSFGSVCVAAEAPIHILSI